jgi:hypothetical protein
MISLSQTAMALCMPLPERYMPEDACVVEKVYAYRLAEINALGALVDHVQDTFLRAQRLLDGDERRVWEDPPARSES